jgi:hydrogenase-4 component F
MSLNLSVLFLPILAILFFILWGGKRSAGMINSIFSALTCIASVWLGITFVNHGPIELLHGQLYLDALNICYLVLTTFILTTTAIFSQRYMLHNLEEKRINSKLYHLYHILYQAFAFTMILALMANNLGILWVAVEGATLATALLVSLYRTPEAIEAAWKYFVLCIVGIALALFGTICVYFSAQGLLSQSGPNALLWTFLHNNTHLLNPQILTIAFVFLFVGYGTKVGLVPLHFWLPDAHSESPAPMSALLSGLLLNLGLYAILRFKMIVDPALGNNLTGYLMMTFGLLSFAVASFLMYRQKNIKRLFSYSSIEHLGLITFAFGLGKDLAVFAALFYSLMHSLVKSAIFMTVGDVIMLFKTQELSKIRGLIQLKPIVGWSLLISTLAICGFPPFGIFTSKLLIIISTAQQHLWLAMIIVAILLVAIAALLYNIHTIVYGKPPSTVDANIKISTFPIILHLAMALWLGIYLPTWLNNILQQATSLLTNQTL